MAAPADVTYGAAREMSLASSPVVRAIFRGRELLMHSSVAERPEERPPQSLIDEVLSIGWGILAQEPGREIVVGAVTQPWKGNVNSARCRLTSLRRSTHPDSRRSPRWCREGSSGS